MNCPEAMENLAAYLDGEVDGAPRRALDAHFAGCEACAAERKAQAAAWRLLDLLGTPAMPSSPEAFDAALAARVRAAGRPRGRILGLPLPAAAAAAALVLAAVGTALLLGGGGGGGTGGAGTEVAGDAPPEALLEDLALLESLEALQDGDLEVVDRLVEMGDEDLAVLGG